MNSAEGFLETLDRSGLPPLRGGRPPGEGFRASVVSRDLGPLRLTELVTPQGECFRDARSAQAAHSELWQVEVVSEGQVRAEQGGSTAVLGPTDLVLIDPVRPVRFASSATTHVTMLIPRHSLRLGADDAARLTGVRIPGDRGPGALVSSLARDMARSLDGFRAHEADRSAAAVIELIAVMLSARLGDTRPVADEILRTRIMGFIEARLSDRDLTCGQGGRRPPCVGAPSAQALPGSAADGGGPDPQAAPGTVPRGSGEEGLHGRRCGSRLGIRRSCALQPAVQGHLRVQPGCTPVQRPCTDGQ